MLIAGHGDGDSGAVGNGYREDKLTREITALIADRLSRICNVTVGDTDRNWFEYLGKSTYDFTGFNYVLEIHFNSGGGTGTEIYVTVSEKTTGAEEAIVKKISEAVGYKNRGVKRKNFRVISRVKNQGVSSALLEVCFIDNASDMSVYAAEKDKIAAAVVSGIAEGFGLKEEKRMEFGDVKGHYAEEHINDLLNMGIVNGDDSGNFNPDQNITRADAAIMVRNAIRYITGA